MSDPLRLLGSQEKTSSDVPIGVRFSAILLVLWSCALGLCGLFCLTTVVISLTHRDRSVASLVLGFVLFVSAALFCLQAAKALRNAQRWGARVAMICGGISIAFGGVLIRDFFRVGKHSADEYFLYPVAPIFLILGAWLCVYLNIPRVKSYFEKRLD